MPQRPSLASASDHLHSLRYLLEVGVGRCIRHRPQIVSNVTLNRRQEKQHTAYDRLPGAVDSTRSGSPSLPFDQDDVRLLLHLLDDDLAAVWRDVEVAHRELRPEVRQLTLYSGDQVD
jgi:hypothetical protein